jgi:uncharacterized protein YjbI with pentapeptide repeats
LLQFGILVLLLAARLTSQAQDDFQWKDASGNAHDLSALEEIRQKHIQWIDSGKTLGTRADLTGADLTGANLTLAELSEAMLTGAKLHGAELAAAHLDNAHLSKADLTDANLRQTDLAGADLTDVQLSGADLYGADLHDAYLNDAKLTGADLRDAGLEDAQLYGAHLNNAHLSNANLTGANLRHADLVGADLTDVQLSGAKLDGADLSGATLSGADLGRALFEPKSIPELRGIAAAKNLELLTYDTNPDALVQLRKQFEDGGFRDQERKITYALKREEAEQFWKNCTSRQLPGEHAAAAHVIVVGEHATRAILSSSDSVVANCSSLVLNKVFFDWTCQYGMSPGRPLILGTVLWLICSLLYFVCLQRSGKTGLYRVYEQRLGEAPAAPRRFEKISISSIRRFRGRQTPLQFLRDQCVLLCASMFFSLMSAFNIGFRDINFGRWLRLLTRQEFDTRQWAGREWWPDGSR